MAHGFTVADGKALSFGIADCAALPTCEGSNASGSYLLFSVPPTPDTPLFVPPGVVLQPGVPAGQTTVPQLNANEAVLIYGTTPPTARYFSVAPYLYDRTNGATRPTVFASVADATNNANVRTSTPGPFAARTAFLVVADAGVEASARAALHDAGWNDDTINTIVVSPDLVRLGTDATADTIAIIGRVALFDDPAAGASYLENVPLSVLRLTSNVPGVAPLPAPARTPRTSATDETALAPAVDALGAAIEASLGSTPHTELSIASATQIGTQLAPARCIAMLTNCLGEVSDTTYAAGPLNVLLGGSLLLTDDPGDYFLIYGVDHEAAGMATYSNVVVLNMAKQAGVAAFESPQMPGSADAYVPGDPDRAKLFVVKVARSCGNEPHCLAIGTGFPGVALDGSLAFVFRAYLAPGFTVSPDPAKLLTEHVIHVGGQGG